MPSSWTASGWSRVSSLRQSKSNSALAHFLARSLRGLRLVAALRHPADDRIKNVLRRRGEHGVDVVAHQLRLACQRFAVLEVDNGFGIGRELVVDRGAGRERQLLN